MSIEYENDHDFYTGIYKLVEMGLDFKARADQRIIYLEGGS